MLYEIKANGRFYDIVYYDKPISCEKVKKEYQEILKTKDVKVKKRSSL